jgi:putative ABC transport system ATP-binding protein
MNRDIIIEARALRKIFRTGEVEQEVLRGIDLHVAEGEFVAIMGRSGAGKSTLLYQLSALDEPTSGEIFVAGQLITHLNEVELADFRLYTLGYIFQDYALIPELSAIENIITPLLMRGMSWEEAMVLGTKALVSVNLENKAEHLPAQLSGGEQQRVSIARAVAGQPKILFADEPTANLDSVSGKMVIELLSYLHKQGQTIVMVTHEVEYTRYCDRTILLEDGAILPFPIGSTRTDSSA